ncbi:hypothetical protein FisN_39Lh018 [Fistulifera solaris]|uniref:Uncharacterized protein n=1 Tax=Fistulifera solaris TaxID=1519565 RepID=A0A1Z5K7S6_FISSO|nr:hypothetical protein FisN_39Lh018 [Fistulifera solaris]|eukprot:GAX22151.1 hypothetical protein FisN_39Lh018 [Fistulifera solaris]
MDSYFVGVGTWKLKGRNSDARILFPRRVSRKLVQRMETMKHSTKSISFQQLFTSFGVMILFCQVILLWFCHHIAHTWCTHDDLRIFRPSNLRPKKILPAIFPTKERKEAVIEPRVCMSPEKDVPWPLSGTCNQPLHGVSGVSAESRSCGFCSSPYLQSIANQLEEYRDQCKDLVVYGVAFGTKYVGFINEAAILSMDESVCAFHFVLQEEADAIGDLRNNEIVIRVDGSKMPYKDMRRNVKILKMSPLDLFPWAERVIWRDTKLLPKKILPRSYMAYFNRTVENYDSCASLVSLPIHDSSMGNRWEDLDFPEYKGHCGAVVDAAIKRPTVSDGLETLVNQCQLTIQHYDHEPLVDGKTFLDRSLIDSALMVWDMRTVTCKKYIGDLGCSWLDEIHCFSDRDQVSFGRALDASGVSVSKELPNGDQLFFKDSRPTVHIARPDCHWYFQGLDICYDPNYENLRVAVVIAGTHQRFMFSTALQHVLAPLVRQSHNVDLYLSLTTGKAKAYRFAGAFHPDPLLEGKNETELRETITREVQNVGATVQTLLVSEQIEIENDPLIFHMYKQFKKKLPNEHPLEYFPALDIRNDEVRARNKVGNHNFLRLFRAIENLWESVIERERAGGKQYDYVLFLRDDSYWFRDFHLNGVVALGGDIFIPACDARDPPLDPHEMCDHGMVARRGVADIFGRYFSTMFKLDLAGCAANLTESFTKQGKRGCNTEMILKWTADTYDVNVTRVGQGYMQFQRSARVQTVNGSITECFHKFCQSRHDPLILGTKHADMQMCKSLETK